MDAAAGRVDRESGAGARLSTDDIVAGGSVKLDADKLVPPDWLAIQNAKDRAVRRWGGIAILFAAVLLSAGAIMSSPDESKTADKAWSLIFVIVGYAGAYMFGNSNRTE